MTASTGQIPAANGDGMTALLQHYITNSANRDAAIERVASSVQSLATEFSRKLDENERDTRKQFDHFATNVASQFQNVVTKFETALAARDAKLESVSAEFLKSRQAPWTQLIALGMFLLAFGGSIGWMAYNPINDRTTKIEDALTKIADSQIMMRDWALANFVSQKDLDARTERGKEDRERTNRAIESIQANIFTRDVHVQHWNNIDASIAATNLRVDAIRQDLQRQLDTVQKSLGDTYTARDALLENKQRISEMERLIREMLSHGQSRPGVTLP